MAGEVIHVPLVHGTQEGADPKLLPQGWLTRAENVRFRKDGRLGSRYGYDVITAAAQLNTRPIGAGNAGPKRSVYVTPRTAVGTAGRAYERTPEGSYVFLRGRAPSVGVPQRTAAVRNLQYTCVASDVVRAGASIVVVYHDFDLATGVQGDGVQLVVFETSSMWARVRWDLGAARNPKLVAIDSTTVGVVYEQFSILQYQRLDVPTDIATTPTFSLNATVAVPFAGRAFAFDVAAYDATVFLLTYETSAVNLRWGEVNIATGVFTTTQDQVIANPARPSIARVSGSTDVALVWAEGATFDVGNLHYLRTTIGAVPVTAKTTLDSSGLVVGFPTAGPDGTNFAFAWNRSDNVARVSRGGAAAGTFPRLAVVSRPFVGPNSSVLAWFANFADSGNTSGPASYKLIDIAALVLLTTGAMCEAVCCQHDAMPGAYYTTTATYQSYIENRRSCVAATATDSSPGATAIGVALPVVTSNGFGADVIRIESGNYVDRLVPANLNGQLFFSGPRVFEFDGISFFEAGLGDGPEYVAVANAGAGSIPAGTYQYCCVYSWFDASGYRHRSPPSDQVEITLASASNVTVSYSVLPFSERTYGTSAEVCTEVYRTLADEQVFHLVNDGRRLPFGTISGTARTYTDSATDDDIRDNEVLYTQGERGGLSGLLQNDEPPPCKYMCAGNGRLLMGGLEDRSAVQWSKLVFPGEPVQFANSEAYRQKVDGAVTAVAHLDGAWFIFTNSRIYVSQGEGPDDTGAGGEFGVPVQLSSDVGCISQRSVVACQHGIFFQASGGLYLLPRGQGSPEFIGQPVRDVLASYPFIAAAALVATETVVVFLALTSDATDGRILVFDTLRREWTVDNLFAGAANSARVFRTLDVYDGKLILDGTVGETSAYVDAEPSGQSRAIVMTVATGDVTPFGPMGNGRVRGLDWMGEYRSASTVTVEVSHDSGQTLDAHVGTWVTSGTAGDRLEREYRLKIVRTKSPRFRLTSTPTSPGEGTVFNAISLEVFPEKGTPRLAAAQKA